MGFKKEYYGRGPTGAKAWMLDDYLVVVLEGGLTRSEETLLAAGKEDVVRAYRLSLQETMRATMVAVVEETTGRTVVNYHSQILFPPTRVWERCGAGPEPQ